MSSYALRYVVDEPFDAAIDSVTAALADEGFGVLSDIDVQATFAEKLDEDFRRYRILGACNPEMAHEALGEDLAVGGLLPCNVVVYETDDESVAVAAVDPVELLSLADAEPLDRIAEDARDRFERAFDGLETAAKPTDET